MRRQQFLELTDHGTQNKKGVTEIASMQHMELIFCRKGVLWYPKNYYLFFLNCSSFYRFFSTENNTIFP